MRAWQTLSVALQIGGQAMLTLTDLCYIRLITYNQSGAKYFYQAEASDLSKIKLSIPSIL